MKPKLYTLAILMLVLPIALPKSAFAQSAIGDLEMLSSFGGDMHGLGIHKGHTLIAIGDRIEVFETPLDGSAVKLLSRPKARMTGFDLVGVEFASDRLALITRDSAGANGSPSGRIIRNYRLSSVHLDSVLAGRLDANQNLSLLHEGMTAPLFSQTDEKLYWWSNAGQVKIFTLDPFTGFMDERINTVARYPLHGLAASNNDLWLLMDDRTLLTFSAGSRQLDQHKLINLRYFVNDMANDLAGRFVFIASNLGLYYYPASQVHQPRSMPVINHKIEAVAQVHGGGMAANAESGLILIDVDHSAPAVDFEVPDAALPAAVDGQTLAARGSHGGVDWYDLGHGKDPKLIAEYRMPGRISHIVPLGEGRIVAQSAEDHIGWISGLEGGNPRVEHEVQLSPGILGMARLGDRLIVSANVLSGSGARMEVNGRLYRLDPRDPPATAPEALEIDGLPEEIWNALFHVRDDLIALLSNTGTLYLIEDRGGGPALAATIVIGEVQDIALTRDHLYVAGREDRSIKVYDISDLSLPRLVAELERGQNVLAMSILSDELLVVSREDAPLAVFSLGANPGRPSLRSLISFSGPISDLVADGKTLYVLEGIPENRIWELDLSAPSDPLVSAKRDSIVGQALALDAEILFVAKGESGVTALRRRIRSGAATPETPSPEPSATAIWPGSPTSVPTHPSPALPTGTPQPKVEPIRIWLPRLFKP